MANVRKDTTENVETFLTLGVGESATFPLGMYNTIRGLRNSNPKVLEARGNGKEFSVSTDLALKATVLTRTK